MIGHDKNLDYKVKESVNTRKYLVGLMEKLSQKLMSDKEDDTNALKIVVNILETIMLNYSITEEAFDLNTSTFYHSKWKLEVKLFGSEKHIRTLLIDRIIIQHEQRLKYNLNKTFTATHQRIMDILLSLSTSFYSKVRIQAQNCLSKAISHFSFSFNSITDKILTFLSPDNSTTHEQLKGTLYIILQNDLLSRRNWKLQKELWPLLVKVKFSEKPSITALIRTITGNTVKLEK